MSRSLGSKRHASRVRSLLTLAATSTAVSGACLARPLVAQVGVGPAPGAMQGVVRDSTSGRALAGAAVLLRDSLDHTVGQTVSDEAGRYHLAGSRAARRLRVLRMGFRPADVPLEVGGALPHEVALAAVPPLLAPVRVRAAARCPRQTNTAAALGLLDQVRAGLLATVIAGEQQPRSLTVFSYDREIAPGEAEKGDGRDEERPAAIVRQTVHVRTSSAMAEPFGASRTGAEFVADGFRENSAGGARYFAPDAGTLVDDDFAAGYCFRVVKSDRAQDVGLGFAPPREQGGRIDVDGVLWVDTVARSLRDLTFRYVGLSRNVSALHPGGHVSFREMPTGVAFIDRWSLRLVTGTEDADEDARRESLGGSSAYGAPNYGTRPHASHLDVREIGGELARVTWPGGDTWNAPLGDWRLHLTDARGRPAAGAVARLDGTDFTRTADSAGVAEFADLLPGPYRVSVIDPQFEALGRALAVEQRVVVPRDSTIDTRLTVEMAARAVAAQNPAPVALAQARAARAAHDTSSVAIGDGKSIERLFAGRFAGVNVSLGADGGLQISMRGTVSSNGDGDEPLYIIDGTPLPKGSGGIVFLNPYDIEKIEVLKNAQDISIYGVRGGNGVIRITTRRPGRR
ncbi:MAG TPA: carboxypeptidase regulatory-like domain-containing protein [Gemmatirosa sp.]